MSPQRLVWNESVNRQITTDLDTVASPDPTPSVLETKAPSARSRANQEAFDPYALYGAPTPTTQAAICPMRRSTIGPRSTE